MEDPEAWYLDYDISSIGYSCKFSPLSLHNGSRSDTNHDFCAQGYIFFIASNNPQLRYAGCFLCFTGVVPLGPFFLSWGLNNIPGPKSRAITAALIPGLGTIGSVVSTWTYTSNFAPRYLPGNAINLATTTLVFFIGGFLTWYVRWENKRRDRGELDYRLEGLTEEEAQGLGHKHPHFRYVD